MTDGADGSFLSEAERNERLGLSNIVGRGALGRPWIVAGQPVARSSFQQRWLYLRADIDAPWTARMKPTSRGRIDRAGDFTGQNNSVCLLLRVWYRNRGQKGNSIWMQRVFEELVSLRDLNYLSKIHDRHSVTDVSDGT